jgi:hypothetical protein
VNDYWNDPPDEPEGLTCPECDDGTGEYVVGDRVTYGFRCDTCGHCWFEPATEDPEPPEEVPVEYYRKAVEEMAKKARPAETCPHGNPWGECGDCDHIGDIAYDAARERRMFNR